MKNSNGKNLPQYASVFWVRKHPDRVRITRKNDDGTTISVNRDINVDSSIGRYLLQELTTEK